MDGWVSDGPGRANRTDTPVWATGVRGGAVRRGSQSAANRERQLEREQMAYWWARKKAEYEGGLVARWDAEGGSSGSGGWAGDRPDRERRGDLLAAGWTGGVRGEVAHHSVGVREAWWGDHVTETRGGSGLVLDLEAGREAVGLDEAARRARARKAKRKHAGGASEVAGV